MSGKGQETLRKILAICDGLSAEGVRPSYDLIQKRLGGNNPSAIRQALVIWYDRVFRAYHDHQNRIDRSREDREALADLERQHVELMDTILKLHEEADKYQDKIVSMTSSLADYKQKLAGSQDYWMTRMIEQQNAQEVQHAKQIAQLESKIKSLEIENRVLSARTIKPESD